MSDARTWGLESKCFNPTPPGRIETLRRKQQKRPGMAKYSTPTPPPTLEALERAGWSNAELIWEQIQETAAEAQATGDPNQASELWAGALEVAREHFAPDDPRLASSLLNCALDKRRAGDSLAARALLDEAKAVWSRTDAWIDALRPERRARSSTFHLRLQAKHRGAYDRFSKERYAALRQEAQAFVQACDAEKASKSDRLARWHRERPAGFTDMRKLLGAVLLLADPD